MKAPTTFCAMRGRKLGDDTGAEEAERLYLEAEAARETQQSREH